MPVLLLTSGTSWTVPTSIIGPATVICIGAGGGGGTPSGEGGAGGGGGAVSISSLTFTASSTVYYRIAFRRPRREWQ